MEPAGGLRQFGQVFDAVAEEYDAHRPGYPAALVDAAVARGGLGAGARVLEVGCGTGKLTESLAERGLVVDAVDPGENMIAAARRRVGETDDVRFHLGRFEDADLPQRAYDAVFSATAFHWVDPAVGWRKAASHLKPGGLLALLTHLGLPDETTGFDDAFVEIVRAHAPEVVAGWRPQRELDEIVAGVEERRENVSAVWDWLATFGAHGLTVDEATALFEDVELAVEVSEHEETADELIAHHRTTSLWFRIAPERRPAFEADERRLVEERGGTVRFSTAAVLVTAHSTG